LVLKNLQSQSVRLQSDKTEHGLEFNFEGFPFLGLWAAPAADFVCIEPWCGIADSVNTDQQLSNKEGIICLPAGEKFEATWKVRFF
jgi:galactose mutarotase-like enzyme